MDTAQPDGTIAVREGEGFERERVAAYLRGQIAGLPEGPLEVRQYPSGASNLTFLLRIGSWEGVLRRPPLGPLPPKAHDMVREARLLQRLHAVYPLAPNPYAICEDQDILGVPFYVMERRHGVVLDDAFPRTSRRRRNVAGNLRVGRRDAGQAARDRLAGCRFGAFGYREGFPARQVRGWIGRYDAAKTDDYPQVAPLVRWFEANLPASPAPTIIHNDFKLNNLLLAPRDLARSSRSSTGRSRRSATGSSISASASATGSNPATHSTSAPSCRTSPTSAASSVAAIHGPLRRPQWP